MPERSYFEGPENFYEERSWGALGIKPAKDLPTLKLRYLIDLLNSGGASKASFLEIGCGSGRIIASIREWQNNLRLTGLDRSREQLKIAKRADQAQEVSYILGDGQILPFQDETFDYVAIMDFLEHVPNPLHAIREAWRVLKRNGHLYAFIPAEGQPYSIYRISQKIFGIHFKELTCGHIQQFTLQELDKMVGDQFRIVNRKFSYHFLGSVMDYIMFVLLLNKGIAKIFWAENRYYYQGGKSEQSKRGNVLNLFLTFGNAIAFYESTILQNIRWSACGVHFTAVKMPK